MKIYPGTNDGVREGSVNRRETREIDVYELISHEGRYVWRHLARASGGAEANIVLDSLREKFTRGIFGFALA